jgi:4-amino-4-deoxy-L-arabinose transferase-like glycosyltransferase
LNSTEHRPPLAYAPREEAYRPTPWPLLITVVVALVGPMILLSQVLAYYRTDVVDDQMFGYYGWRIAHGATVYVDVWDNKPPGIYWINALGMLVGGGSYFGVIAMCTAALVVAHVCFLAISASLFYRGAAAFATVLLSFWLTHGFYTGGTNRTETFLVAWELAAVLFYVRGYAKDRWWKWYLAGMCCGAAFLFKQVGLAAWGAMGLHTIILMLTREVPFRQAVARCFLLLGGLCATVALAAAYLASQGALDDAWFATFTFNHAYFATGKSQFPYSFVSWMLLKDHFFPIMRLPLLMAIAGCIHAVLWRLRPQHRPPEIERPLRQIGAVCPRYMLLFAIWYAVAFYGALISPDAFRHYLVPSIPPLMLMAAYLVNVLQAEMRLPVRLEQRAWVVAAFVAIAYFSIDAVTRQWEEVSKVWVFRSLQGQRAEWEIIGDAVAGVTTPDQKVQCWGYFPGVYLEARRINAVRYTTTEKVGQVPGQAQFVLDELQKDLFANPPAVIVLSYSDYLWLHGQSPDKPKPQAEFGEWIDDNYEMVADIAVSDNVRVYKRKDLVRPEDFKIIDRIKFRD